MYFDWFSTFIAYYMLSCLLLLKNSSVTPATCYMSSGGVPALPIVHSFFSQLYIYFYLFLVFIDYYVLFAFSFPQTYHRYPKDVQDILWRHPCCAQGTWTFLLIYFYLILLLFFLFIDNHPPPVLYLCWIYQGHTRDIPDIFWMYTSCAQGVFSFFNN